MDTYDKYSSGIVSWVEQVPAHWETCRFKDVFSLSKGLSITKADLEETGVPVVNYGEVHSKYGFEVDPERHQLLCVNLDYLKLLQKSLLKKGDFVFADTSEDLDGSGNFTHLASDRRIFAGYHTMIARPKKNIARYLAYLADSHCYRTQVRSSVKGVKVYSITRGILNPLQMLLPPLPEQKAIAGYLDRETERIDRKVGLLEEKARLYKELKQSLINETVTRGLDKSAPLRPSGVDWIGNIPEHWRIVRVKDIGTQSKKKNGANPRGEMLSVSGYRGIEVKNYEHEHQKRTDEELADYRVVTSGQLVVNTMWLNFRGLGVSEVEGYVSPAYRAYDIKGDIVGRYLHHLMRSDLYVFGYCIYLQGIRPNSLQMKTIDFEAFPIVLPPVGEQKKIVEYIDEKTTKIDQIVEAIGEQVKLLKELRKTLINDVVTGKIRVTETAEALS